MEEHNRTHSEEEIDISYIFQKIGNFFKNILIGFLQIITFYYEKKWILVALVIVGGVLGYFWENSAEDKFKNNFIVATNYDSADYLYNKIEAVDSKIKLVDTTFLEKAFGEHYLKVNSIEIEPITNIYEFVAESESNRELFDLLSEDEDMAEFIEEPVNSRNYPNHMIDLVIEGVNKDLHKIITDNFFTYLNSNEYYNNSKRISLKNTLMQIDQNQQVRKQIDAVISSVTNPDVLEGKNPMVSIKENQVIDDLLKRKNLTLNQDRRLQTSLENEKNVVQVVDANYQIEFEESIFNKNKKFLLPFILIFLYSIIYLAKYLVRKSQSFLAQNKN